jgi:glycosyltransferase involved in cell wall biosynthesis
MNIGSMFLMHMGSNVGYAIAPLERLFFDIGLALSGNDQNLVHFGYTDFVRGKPVTLPQDFENLIEFNFRSEVSREHQRLANYAREHNIKLVIVFDVQPIHPAFRALRHAGVSTILGYYGCEISSLMPMWKLAVKRLSFALSSSKMDGLIFESQAMADLAVRGRGVPQNRIDVVPLGVDLELFHPVESSYVYDVMGLPRDRKVIAYAGHMESRKGVHSLVRAAIDLLVRRKRKDVCFALFGNRPHENEEYEEMYVGSGIEKMIRFAGYRSDLPEIY